MACETNEFGNFERLSMARIGGDARRNEDALLGTRLANGTYSRVTCHPLTHEKNASESLFCRVVSSTLEFKERLLWVCVPLATGCTRR